MFVFYPGWYSTCCPTSWISLSMSVHGKAERCAFTGRDHPEKSLGITSGCQTVDLLFFDHILQTGSHLWDTYFANATHIWWKSHWHLSVVLLPGMLRELTSECWLPGTSRSCKMLPVSIQTAVTHLCSSNCYCDLVTSELKLFSVRCSHYIVCPLFWSCCTWHLKAHFQPNSNTSFPSQ